jgi:hypothetical protein
VKTALTLTAALLLASAAPAAARIVVIDPATGAAIATPVHDDTTHVMAWTDDGTALYVRAPHRQVLRVDVATGVAVRQPQLASAESVGPGGRSIAVSDVAHYRTRVQLRAADGRVIASHVATSYGPVPQVAWSRDGSRVAVAVMPTLIVLDTTSGAVLRRTGVPGSVRLDAQAFSPDGSALVVGMGTAIVRLNVAWDSPTVLYQVDPNASFPDAAWGADGRIAVTTGDRIVLVGSSPVTIDARTYGADAPRWSPDASALLYVTGAAPVRNVPRNAVELVVPGGKPRSLVSPTRSPVYSVDWAPDSRGVAIALGPKPPLPPKRYPWPRYIRHHYDMFSAAGDAAVRHLVVHVAHGLRHGADKARAMDIVCAEHTRIERRFPEVSDTAVAEPLIGELNKWFRAAGFEELDAEEQVDC